LPVRRHAALAAVLAGLLAALLPFGATAFAAQVAPAAVPAPVEAVASGPKVVIVVGAVETVTSSFRTDADSIYAEAIKYTSNVVKVYSPNATWAAVSAAAQGASIFIYLGHGYGFPSPYKTVLTPSVHDGMGLNEVANNGDSDKKYYGESVVAAGIKLAKNAVVILDHACYSAGSSESGMAEPTIPVAKQRIDNFASGFLRAGARAVMADASDGNVIAMIRSIFTTHQTIGNAWTTQYFSPHHVQTWQPLRNPAYTAAMDPDTMTTGFHRSLVADFNMTTDEVIAGATAPRTDTTPSTLVAPGAAAVGSADVSLSGDASLASTPSTTLAAGTKVRVDALQASPAAAQVETFDAKTTGWTAQSGLVPKDSSPPLLWSLDGATTITPNFDGDHDSLSLVARFSESVSWTATFTDPGGTTIRNLLGSGDLAFLSWVPLSGGTPLPAGDYGLAIHAADAWGNAPVDTTVTIHVVSSPVPGTGVLTFKPAVTATTSTTVGYSLVFASPVTGVTASDFTITGSAAGCVMKTPTGSGTTWSVGVTSCGSGRVQLQLEPKTVSDGTNLGPAGLIAAPSVTIDRTLPTATAPKASLDSGATISGATLRASITWTGSDSGSGVSTYDVARSTDGGSFAVIATGLTATTLATPMSSGHAYRYEVRAHDKAGNTGSWVAASTWYPSLVQETSTAVTWSGAWTTVTSTNDSGGSARQSASAGASATYTFTGRAVAVVLGRCAGCGQVQVFYDRVLVATVDTNAGADAYRWVGYRRATTTGVTHTLRLVVVGTVGQPTVSVDAFEVIR
jgi:hypothetical protein